jgi:hypothetical protein
VRYRKIMSKEFVITLVPALIMAGFAVFALIKISH